MLRGRGSWFRSATRRASGELKASANESAGRRLSSAGCVDDNKGKGIEKRSRRSSHRPTPDRGSSVMKKSMDGDDEKVKDALPYPIFGRRLEEMASYGRGDDDGGACDGRAVIMKDGVPRIVHDLTTHLRNFGMTTEGLFRKSARGSDIERVVLAYQRNGTSFLADEHVAAGTLKRFLRELPVAPMGDASVYKQWLMTAPDVTPDPKTMLQMMRSIAQCLPVPHHNLMKHLLAFFADLASYSSVNKVDTRALAILLAPCLMHHVLVSKDERHLQYQVVELLIQYHDVVFGDRAIPSAVDPTPRRATLSTSVPRPRSRRSSSDSTRSSRASS